MYVNIEFYEKKTIGVAAVTMVATLINIVLNLILIPLNLEKGYIIAAYTTLIGYIILFIMHYVLVKKMNMAFVYDIKFIIGGFLVTLIVSTVSNIMYSMNFLRYMIIIVYCIVMIYVVYQNKSLILKFLGKKE